MDSTDRIPGFAICARCAARRKLGSCRRCGLLVCGDCRGEGQCAVCHLERLADERRAQRRARLQEVGRRAAVIALVAASGATGLGAAFLPDGPMYTAAYGAPTAVELRMLPTPETALESSRTTRWSEPLTFRCFEVGDGITCCVVGTR